MTDKPITEALEKLKNPTNELGIGVEGSQEEGVTIGGFVSKDLGQGKTIWAEGGWNNEKGWTVSAWFRKIWGKS